MANAAMNLTEIVSLDQIIPKVSASDRWSLIELLVDRLVRADKIRSEDREAVLKAIKDREATKCTGIGYGIALPHASVNCIADVVAIVARLDPPIDFQALDNQPVRLCVLFLTPQGQFQKHLHTLSAFARFLSDKNRRDQLETAKTAEEILAVFRAAA
jgi:mannitol/fructose-specific phosphotransferase system IIA component (Ntr-type)